MSSVANYIQYVNPATFLTSAWEKIPVDALLHSKDVIELMPTTGAIVHTQGGLKVQWTYVQEMPYVINWGDAFLTIEFELKRTGAEDVTTYNTRHIFYEPVPSWASTMEFKLNEVMAERLDNPGWIVHHKIIKYTTKSWIDGYGSGGLGYHTFCDTSTRQLDAVGPAGFFAGDTLCLPGHRREANLDFGVLMNINQAVLAAAGEGDLLTWVKPVHANTLINLQKLSDLGYNDWVQNSSGFLQNCVVPKNGTTAIPESGLGQLTYPLWMLFDIVKSLKAGPVNLTSFSMNILLKAPNSGEFLREVVPHDTVPLPTFVVKKLVINCPLYVYSPDAQVVLNNKRDTPALIPYTLFKYYSSATTGDQKSLEYYFHSLASCQSVTVYRTTPNSKSQFCTTIAGYTKKYVTINSLPVDYGREECQTSEVATVAPAILQSKSWRDFLDCCPSVSEPRYSGIPDYNSFTWKNIHGCICTNLGKGVKSDDGGWYTLDSQVSTIYHKMFFAAASEKTFHMIVEADILAVISATGFATLINTV